MVFPVLEANATIRLLTGKSAAHESHNQRDDEGEHLVAALGGGGAAQPGSRHAVVADGHLVLGGVLHGDCQREDLVHAETRPRTV